MTTKIKIIAGFVVLIVLTLVLAFVSYSGVGKSSDNFDENSRLAALNVLLSDMISSVNASGMHMESFLLSLNPSTLQSAQAALDTLIEQAQKTFTYMVKPERQAAVTQMIKDAEALKTSVTHALTVHSEIGRSYNQEFLPLANEITVSMNTLLDLVAATGNPQTAVVANNIWADLALAREASGSYFGTLNVATGQAAKQYFSSLTRELDQLDRVASTEDGRRQVGTFRNSITNFSDKFDALYAQSLVAASDIAAAQTLMSGLSLAIGKLNAEVDEQMAQYAVEASADNAATQTGVLLISVAGVVIGVAIALFIILGLSAVLNKVSRFASEVAAGDFEYDPKVKEGGEIGTMIKALKNIPETLKGVVEQGDQLADDISGGRFRKRLNLDAFNGGFKSLANAINVCCQAYTTAFDSLPVGVVNGDKERNMLFLNKNAQAVAGGNAEGLFCGDKLKSDACQNRDKCFGLNCMSGDRQVGGEVTIYPGGQRVDLSVSNIPLHNLKGQTVGYMEITSDISQIKAQELVMRRVANNASDISDRVAAAAEELAAQVEQISRGTDMQRRQMESTASAMTEMNSTVLEVARNAAQASEQSDLTRNNAVSGAELVNKVVHSIRAVNSVALKLQDNMGELGTQAESIGSVMNVISDIADQTNLLALNAAIEAARAGEAGRGFAVVADEVRKLAEKTMLATQEVGASISAVQNSAKTNIGEVGMAVKSVTEATELANSSGEALKQIVSLAQATSSVVASIATAAEEQSATSEEIANAVEEVNKVVGETSDGMVQSSSAVQDLSRMAQELRRLLDELS